MAGQSMSGQQIYDNFAKAVGPDGLAQAADCVTEIQSRYDDRATEIRSLAAAELIAKRRMTREANRTTGGATW